MESRAQKETRTAERDGLANSVEFSQAALNYKFKFFGARLLITTKNHQFAWKIGSCSTNFSFESRNSAALLYGANGTYFILRMKVNKIYD
jgi:hypothetical protein